MYRNVFQISVPKICIAEVTSVCSQKIVSTDLVIFRKGRDDPCRYFTPSIFVIILGLLGNAQIIGDYFLFQMMVFPQIPQYFPQFSHTVLLFRIKFYIGFIIA